MDVRCKRGENMQLCAGMVGSNHRAVQRRVSLQRISAERQATLPTWSFICSSGVLAAV